MKDWSLEIGLYPGVLVGARTYENEHNTEHVLYMPFIELILTTFKEQEDEHTN